MFTQEPVFHSGNEDKIWKKFCGFFDLPLGEFMEIQEALLMEQINLISGSPLGKAIMLGARPKSVEEFRSMVPLTKYEDYVPYIGDCQTEHLVEKPATWVRTSGRSGKFKWVPYTEKALERHGDAAIADLIVGTTTRKGEVRIGPGSRFLFILAPRPYMSGISSWIFAERYGLKVIPPPELSEKLSFQDRISTGFRMAMKSGMDSAGAVATALYKTGETFANRSQGMGLSPSMLHPKVLFRLLRALLRSKMQHRPLLPRDIWPVKGLLCSGTDAFIYKEQLEYYWGQTPHEVYGLSEAGIVAMQSWKKKGLMFYPYMDFFEFIPEEEMEKSKQDKNYHPKTVLIDEVKPGEVYEMVITNFHGMPFLRYRPGDLVRCIGLEEKETGISLPQFAFHARADGLIYLFNIVMLDEALVWQAIDSCDIKIEDWTARKEYENKIPILNIYLELKEGEKDEDLTAKIHQNFIRLSPLYEEAILENERNPVRVTLVPPGSFQKYYEKKREEGADLAHLKPPHMNATDDIIRILLSTLNPSEVG